MHYLYYYSIHNSGCGHYTVRYSYSLLAVASFLRYSLVCVCVCVSSITSAPQSCSCSCSVSVSVSCSSSCIACTIQFSPLLSLCTTCSVIARVVHSFRTVACFLISLCAYALYVPEIFNVYAIKPKSCRHHRTYQCCQIQTEHCAKRSRESEHIPSLSGRVSSLAPFGACSSCRASSFSAMFITVVSDVNVNELAIGMSTPRLT